MQGSSLETTMIYLIQLITGNDIFSPQFSSPISSSILLNLSPSNFSSLFFFSIYPQLYSISDLFNKVIRSKDKFGPFTSIIYPGLEVGGGLGKNFQKLSNFFKN